MLARYLLLSALVLTACSRSALQSPADGDRRSGAAGTAPGATPPATSSPQPRDGGPPDNPSRDAAPAPARDAGMAPGSVLDAGLRDAAEADAAAVDASVPDPSEPVFPPEPEPLRAPGDLVFVKNDNAATSLWALRLSDFSVRRLDPPAALRPVAGVPHSYSSDGRKLLIIESDAGETRYRVVYRCREAACAGQPQPARVVLRGPADDQAFETYTASPHAPDSSGMVLQTKRGAFFLAFAADGPREAVQLTEAPHAQAHFVGGSRGVLLANESVPGVTFVDLAAQAPSPRRLRDSDGTDAPFLRTVSPDGRHWLTSHPAHAFSAQDVLAGNLTGTLLVSGAFFEHAGDQWLLLHEQERLVLRSWDGSRQRELPGAEALSAYGCGNRVVLVANDRSTLSSLDLAASANGEPPQPLALTGVPVGRPRFAARCSKAVVQNAERTRTALIDLADGRAVEHERFAHSDFNSRGTLMGSSRGVYTTVRVDTVSNASPLTFTPRRPLDASPSRFAHERSFFVAAGPLLDMMQPRLYRVDFSDAGKPEPVVEALTDRPTEISNLVLTKDDRYLAYDLRLPLLAVDPTTVGQGVYERDLLTGATELIAAPFERAANGRLRLQRIPERRALLVLGDYPDGARHALYVADLDSGEFVRQTPDEAAPRVPLDTSISDDHALSVDGKLLWYRAVGAKPSRFAQRLRFSNAEPLAPAQVLEFEPQLHAYAREHMDAMYDHAFLDALGPLFHARSGASFGRVNEAGVLSRFDLQSGVARVIATGDGPDGRVGVAAFARRRAAVALQRWDPQGNGRITLLKAGSLEREEPVFSGLELSNPRFSPDERWLAFSSGSNSAGSVVHVRDLETGADHVLPHAVDGGRIEVVFFDPAAPRVLCESDQAKLYWIELGSDAAPQLVADGVGYFRQISRDGRIAAWSSDEGTFVSRLDGSLRPRRVGAGTNPSVKLSPSGRRLLVRELDRSDRWQLIRVDQPGAAPVALAGATQHNIEFDPSERYAVGYYDETAAQFMSVWKLDEPATPHPVLTGGETGWSFWVEGPEL